MISSKWIYDKNNGKTWCIVCHGCATVTHVHKDFKVFRCTDCGQLMDRPTKEEKLKLKKKSGLL